MNLTREQEEMLLNPQPGTAAARAHEFGIDLTLTLANLRLTPQQRLERLEAKREFVRQLRSAVRKGQIKK
ncbi:MAG: hypothetical protein U0Z53_31120 [Blastocatellia bacterium]